MEPTYHLNQLGKDLSIGDYVSYDAKQGYPKPIIMGSFDKVIYATKFAQNFLVELPSKKEGFNPKTVTLEQIQEIFPGVGVKTVQAIWLDIKKLHITSKHFDPYKTHRFISTFWINGIKTQEEVNEMSAEEEMRQQMQEIREEIYGG